MCSEAEPTPESTGLPDALVGYSGFVGSNLRRQHFFAECYNSRNIGTIAGRSFRMLVCAGVRAEKWKANADPVTDWRNIQQLIAQLSTVRAERVVLISTVDVYPTPVGVDETTTISHGGHAYGRHRLAFERALTERFHTVIVRLPGVYGTGLKKNVIYDFLHKNQVEKIDSRGRFQFYCLDRLWDDVQVVLGGGAAAVNLVTEPVAVHEVVAAAFGERFRNELPDTPACYDVRTRYAGLFGRVSYIEPASQVLAGIRAFVERELKR